MSSTTPRQRIAKAERGVIRCAMGIVNSDGWAFIEEAFPTAVTTDQTQRKPLVLFPGSMRRLEGAIARLKQARKDAKPRRRKYT